MSGIRRVIVGVSGSPGSIAALRRAASIARGDDAPLIAVHAWVPPGGDYAERRAPSVHLRHLWQREAAQRLRDAIRAAWGGSPAGVTVEQVVLRGPAGPVLVRLADSGDDLLVLGSGRRNAATRLWHGQVGRYCLAHAQCPLLAVPPAALARQAWPSRWIWSLLRRELTMDQVLREFQGPGPRSRDA